MVLGLFAAPSGLLLQLLLRSSSSIIVKTNLIIQSRFINCCVGINHQKYKYKMVNNTTDQMDRLEQNAQMAEDIIAEIYSQLSEIEKSGVNIVDAIKSPELVRLRKENEILKLEVEKWKEILLLREIKNGRNPVVGRAQDLGKASTTTAQIRPSTAGAGPSPSSSKIQKGAKPAPVKSTSSLPGGTQRPRSRSKSPAPLPKIQEKAKGGKKQVSASTPQPASAATSTTSVASTGSAGGANDDVNVSKLDFRIGLITECERHPDADALYVEKIDLGEEKPRTIISGLVKHVPIEEMRNRMVVVLCNLKPAKMRGILSEGMVMCASSPEKVEILIPPTGSTPGDLVEVEGYPRAPEAVLNPKKKIFETVQPDLKTNEKNQATYKGKLWTVPGKGIIVSSSLVNTMIK